MSGVGPVFPGDFKNGLSRLMLCSALTTDRAGKNFGVMLPEIQLVLAKFQVFCFLLFDLVQGSDLGEKRVLCFSFCSSLSCKLVSELQVFTILSLFEL